MKTEDSQKMPTGEIVKMMERGQVTIPAKYRRKLDLTPETPLNVFEWRGMVIVVPVDLEPKVSEVNDAPPDWTEDTPEEYLKKVRYTPLEELWAKMAKEK